MMSNIYGCFGFYDIACCLWNSRFHVFIDNWLAKE
jgi:hypothetical protein